MDCAICGAVHATEHRFCNSCGTALPTGDGHSVPTIAPGAIPITPSVCAAYRPRAFVCGTPLVVSGSHAAGGIDVGNTGVESCWLSVKHNGDVIAREEIQVHASHPQSATIDLRTHHISK